MCVRRKTGFISSHATCTTQSWHYPFLHFTWVSWAFALFPLTMNICSSPGETSALQASLALTFITRERKALILTQWWDSSWDSVQFPPAHEALSAPFSAPDKHTSIKPIFPHKGLQLPWRLVLGTDTLSYPFLPISLYTGIKTIAAASPSLPKMDFIRVLLLATGLASPSELWKRDVSTDSKWKWIRFGEENAFFKSVIKHTLTTNLIYKGNYCALGWKSCKHLLWPTGHCLHIINLSTSQYSVCTCVTM